MSNDEFICLRRRGQLTVYDYVYVTIVSGRNLNKVKRTFLNITEDELK